jgi:hypothetical protein
VPQKLEEVASKKKSDTHFSENYTIVLWSLDFKSRVHIVFENKPLWNANHRRKALEGTEKLFALSVFKIALVKQVFCW